MTYLGNSPTTQSFIAGTDYFNGNGSTTAFTLSRSVVSTNDIQATVNNVVQQPNDAYTVSGTTITFTSAPSAGTGNIYVRYLSTTTQSITPSQNTVSYSTLNSDNQSKLGISFKNRIINGAMVIDQRNAGASVSISSGGTAYPVDRFRCDSPSTQGITAQQVSASLSGFQNALLYTAGTASTNSADQAEILQFVEGYNVADMQFGTADAKTFTFSFWVKSSLTGTFGLIFENSGNNRQYLTTYSIPTANTWTYVTKTIVGDTSGTWLYTNGRGIGIRWDMGVGTTYSAAATNAWGTSSVYGITGTTKLTQTTGATFYLTGVMLEVGTQATTFDYRSYGTELQLCQRYYQLFSRTEECIYGGSTTTSSGGAAIIFQQVMRTSPTITFAAAGSSSGNISFLNASGNTPSTIGTHAAISITPYGTRMTFNGYTGAFSGGGVVSALYAYGGPITVYTASAEL